MDKWKTFIVNARINRSIKKSQEKLFDVDELIKPEFTEMIMQKARNTEGSDVSDEDK